MPYPHDFDTTWLVLLAVACASPVNEPAGVSASGTGGHDVAGTAGVATSGGAGEPATTTLGGQAASGGGSLGGGGTTGAGTGGGEAAAASGAVGLGGLGGAFTAPGRFQSVDLKGQCRQGTPEGAGETVVVEEGAAYDVTAYGSEIGHHCGQDQGRFVYTELAGDFDVRAQITEMNNFGALHFKQHSTPVKSGLMVRQGLQPGDLYIAIHAASPDEHYPDAFHFDMRREPGGWLGIEGTFFYGYLNNGHAIYQRQYPNIWVRLQRVGTTLRGFASQDGQTWVAPQGHAEYTVDWGSTLLVGLSSSSAPEGSFNAKSVTRFRQVSGFPAPLQ